MPSIETITTSDFVIPSRVAQRDRRPTVDMTLALPAPPAVAVARMPEKVVPQPPVASYRTTDAVPLATLFNTSAPVELDADAIEDEIAKILALLESDGADAGPAAAIDPEPAARDATAPQPPPLPPAIAPTLLAMLAESNAASLGPLTANDATFAAATDPLVTPPTPQTPASPTEVAARLANLIADHKSLLEEFAAATVFLGTTGSTDDAPEAFLIAPDDHAPLPVEADSAQPLAPSDADASHYEIDVPPPATTPPHLPAWSSAAEASSATLRDPAVESLVRAIAAAQSVVPITPAAPPPPAQSTRTDERLDVALPHSDRLPYTATSDSEPARLNPAPGFLGGVAVSGIVGAALWAVLQA